MRTIWRVHGEGRAVAPGAVVQPDERLAWPSMFGIGIQHVVAMFGATFLVPVLTGFPPATTIFFSGIGTVLFVVITRNRVPSYLGSSFAFIAPVTAAQTDGGIAVALGGILVAGVVFFIIGVIIDRAGPRVIELIMPPVVTGAIVAVIGFNLAGVAMDQFDEEPVVAGVTLAAILLIGVIFRNLIGRLSIILGVAVGWILAALMGQAPVPGVAEAGWVGLPEFTLPEFDARAIGLIVPVVVVLIAENTGHVKAVASMTETDLDDTLGKAYMGDGAATALAGLFGGSGTTTYAENIGVMAATRVYSTAAYIIAGGAAIALGLIPKFGAFIATIPVGVLGGATVVLFGLIGVLGSRIWVESRVDFKDPVNLMTAGVALIFGIADFTLTFGEISFSGIATGTFGAIIIYHVLRSIQRVTGAGVLAPTLAPPPGPEDTDQRSG